MHISSLSKSVEKMVVENSAAILTGVAVTGTVATAVLTGRGAFKAAEKLAQHEAAHMVAEQEDVLQRGSVDIPISYKIKQVWPYFLPAAGMGAVTITSIIFSNRISSKRAAALAAAYSLSEKSFGEYKEKVLEQLGVTKEKKLRDDIAQDRMTKNPVGQTIIIGDGEVLCYDSLTGRYFMGNMEKIRKAENKINYEIIHHQGASLSSFYQEIDLPCTSYSDDVGWNLDNLIELDLTSVLTDDGRPCIVIDFKIAPVTGYGRTWG